MFNDEHNPDVPMDHQGQPSDGAFAFYDPETEGVVYRITPSYKPESISDITSETESDASATTIGSDDLSDYFVTMHERQHPASENAMRWLPLDNVRRDILRHVVEKYVYEGNYVGPVRDILSPGPGKGKQRVLEIGTRSGTWIQEMAAEFPHVQFQSLDIAPLTPHAQRSNIEFEVYDFSKGLMLEDNSQDIVFINNGLELVINYRGLLIEAHRVLRPGGLLHIRELGHGLWDPEDLTKRPTANNPKSCLLFDLVLKATEKYGADTNARDKTADWLSPSSDLWTNPQQPRGFGDIHTVRKLHRPYPHASYSCSTHMDPHMIPLLGHLYLMCIRDAVGLLCDGGLNIDQAKALTEEVVEELKNPEKCTILKMYMMYATKRRGNY